MGISNGELANETNFNKSFLDKNTDTETINKISLRRPASGADVEDVQQDINNNKSNIATNTTNISTNTTNISTNASDIQAIEDDYGVANGLATLDGGGKVPASQLPSTLMDYKGNWDANTNTPTLADSIGDSGDVYKVSVAGTQDLGSGSQTFAVGDWVIYNGTIWEKSDNTDAVTSVFGRVGIVTAQSGDYDADQITETTTRFFQEKNNITASAPTVSNDSSQGYSVKSQWFDTSTSTLYICEDASVGSAVWTGISGGGTIEQEIYFIDGYVTNGSDGRCRYKTVQDDTTGTLATVSNADSTTVTFNDTVNLTVSANYIGSNGTEITIEVRNGGGTIVRQGRDSAASNAVCSASLNCRVQSGWTLKVLTQNVPIDNTTNNLSFTVTKV